MKVLIVDDKLTTRKRRHLAHEAEGASVREASDDTETMAMHGVAEPVAGRLNGEIPPTESGATGQPNQMADQHAELQIENEALRANLTKSEAELARFAGLFDFAPVGCLTLSSDSTIRLINLPGAKLLGLERASLLDQPFGVLVAAIDRPIFTDFLSQVFSARTKQVCEITLEGGIRPVIDVQLKGTISSDEMECHVVIIDITTRKQKMKSLEDRSERLSLAIKASNIGLWDWDLQTNKVFYSREWKSQLGLAEDEIANDFSEWEKRVHPDDLAQALKKTREYLANPRGAHEVEFRMQHKDGSWRWMYTRAEMHFNEEGKPAQMLGCHVDITDRKQIEIALRHSEERFRRILESDMIGLVFWGPNDEIIYANNAYLRTIGYTQDDVKAGRIKWREMTPVEFLPPSYQAQRELELNGVCAPYEKEYFHKNGSRVTVLIGAATFTDQPGHGVAFLLDMTERKKIKQGLEDSREQLRALLARFQKVREEERIRISREIHDELGQLLTGLKMDVRWLERKLSESGMPPEFNPLLDRAVAASELADTTIATVQKIAAELRPGPLDQLGLVATISQELRRLQSRCGLLHSLRTMEPAPVLLPELSSELFHIFQEALTNVVRHGQATRVDVSFQRVDRMLELEVADDGVGMAEQNVNSLNSLGLLGMKERAAQHGGTISFARNVPHGTRVIVRIPLGGEA